MVVEVVELMCVFKMIVYWFVYVGELFVVCFGCSYCVFEFVVVDVL